jgi:hypothetical protein
MFLVVAMFFDPQRAWEHAARTGRNGWRTLGLGFLPLLLLGCVAETYGMMHWGKAAGDFGGRHVYGLETALRLQAFHALAGLLLVLICAIALRAITDTFKRRQSFAQALVVAVYGLGPVFIARVADAFPAINPWLSWGIGALLAVTLLYQGLPRVFHIDPAHALGVYLSGSVLVVLISGIMRLVMVMIVQPRLLALANG